MAEPFKLKIVTPEKVFFDGDTTQIIVRTTEGDLGVLAHHTSLTASLVSGPLKIMQSDGSWKIAALSSGLVKIGSNSVSVLVNAIEWADEIDLDWAKRSEEDARQRLTQKTDQHELDLAELKLKRAVNRINVHKMLSK